MNLAGSGNARLKVKAGKVPVNNGSYAWRVGDENCKARINRRDVLAWKTLHHYYNMRRQVSDVGNRPRVTAIDNRTPDTDPIYNPDYNGGVTSITPIVVRMQFLLSYGAKRSGNNYILCVYS